MKLRRFISILLGLALIGLVAYRFYELDMNAGHEYLKDIIDVPDIVNVIMLWAFLAIKVLAILFIAIGKRGTLIAAIFLLPLMFADGVLLELQGAKDLLASITSGDLFKLPLPDMFEALTLPLIAVFWLFYLIIVLFGATKSKSARIILLLVGIAPLALYFVDGLLLTKDYAFEMQATLDLVLSHGICFLLALMLLFSQRAEKRVTKHTWFPKRETLQ